MCVYIYIYTCIYIYKIQYICIYLYMYMSTYTYNEWDNRDGHKATQQGALQDSYTKYIYIIHDYTYVYKYIYLHVVIHMYTYIYIYICVPYDTIGTTGMDKRPRTREQPRIRSGSAILSEASSRPRRRSSRTIL